ncbi:MAG: type I methionyl aminopeptidase [Bacteroidetes bacterium]|jgi:methionyl aminopeptidase|nr:type I methionyl aminopeptidase [Bacteroidota bacterium]
MAQKQKKIILKSLEEIALMQQSARLVSQTLAEVARHIRPGVTTLQLDALAETYIRDHGGEPGFKGLYGCPSTLLTSVNEVVIHGLPTDKPLEDGDIVGVDCGVKMNGYYGDHAYTFEVGEVAPETRQLLQVTKESLYLAIAQARQGNRVGDIGHAVQQYCEAAGYSIVREFVGHGLGRDLHEAPELPNYGRRGHGKQLQNGMTLAIEPMVNMGRRDVRMLPDKWTIVARDGKPSAHYEHNIAIWEGLPVVLSTFDYIEDVLGLDYTTPRVAVPGLIATLPKRVV